jgi:hypothetical protein
MADSTIKMRLGLAPNSVLPMLRLHPCGAERSFYAEYASYDSWRDDV